MKSSCNDTSNNPEHTFCLKLPRCSYTECFFKNLRKYYTCLGTGVLLNSLKYASHNSEVAQSSSFQTLKCQLYYTPFLSDAFSPF